MAEPISIQQLKDASEDAITLADFIYKPANVMIPRRLAADINSLQYYLDYMSSYAQHSYETYDEMVANAANLPNGVSAFVTNDLDATKNGMHTYNGVSFVKGDYQPENAAKDYVESKLGGLEVFDGKVRAQDVSTADGSTQDVKNTEFRSELDSLPIKGGILSVPYKYNSVSEMVADEKLKVGQMATTVSYHLNTAKGGNTYIIESKAAQVEDSGSYIFLANGLVAKGLFDDEVATIQQFGAKSGQDATSEITKLVEYTRANKVRADISGNFNFIAPLNLDMTKLSINFNCNLTCTNIAEVGLNINFRDTVSSGRIEVYAGENSVTYTDYLARKLQVGVRLYNAKSATVCHLRVFGTKRNGIEILSGTGGFGNSNMLAAGTLYTSATGTIKGMVVNTPSSVVQTGSGYTQRSVVSFTKALPSGIAAGDFIYHKGKLKVILGVDLTANSISVFPQLSDTDLVPVDFLMGCGVLLSGLDTNVLGVDIIDASHTPIGVKFESFYGASIGRIHSNNTTVGAAVMSTANVSDSRLGGEIGYLYTESSEIDILQATTGAGGWVVHTAFRDIVNVTLDPLIKSTIDTQRKSISDTPKFENLILNNTTGMKPDTYTSYSSESVNGKEYVLLCEKKNGGKTLSGTVYARGSVNTAQGLNQFSADVHITQSKTAAYTAALDMVANAPITLCTLTYGGKEWFALDLTQFTTYLFFYFAGVKDSTSADMSSVTAATVSNIVPVSFTDAQYKSVGDLKLALDGKSLQLKSPNNTKYKITVTDAGVLTATIL